MAEKFAEALRQYAENAVFKTPYGERKATLSIGVAAITDETGTDESMVRRADIGPVCRQEKWSKLRQGASLV